ncbi:MAG: hypothetical protein ACLPX9_18795 [Rhodomicrobium sp.]
MILRMLLTCAVLLGLAAVASADDSSAKEEAAAPLKHKHHVTRKAAPYREDCCGEGEVYRHIYAGAWYGNQKVVAPVRHVGCCDQVQLPTGEWVECAFSCEITMRKMPLWYWQDQGAGYSHRVTPGYPRADHWTDGWGYQHGYMF